MVNEIIDEKYRDMFGINPKYERIIETKLNDADCYHAFKVLVNMALDHIMKLTDDNRRPDYKDMRLFSKYYGYNDEPGNWNRDVFEGYAPHPVLAKTLNERANLYAPARLTKYVRIGLLHRGNSPHYTSLKKNTPYAYYLPYDFFTTNNPTIKFVPNDLERTNIQYAVKAQF